MASKWRKAKVALGCVGVPSTLEDAPANHATGSGAASGRRLSDALSLTPSASSPDALRHSLPLTPTPSSSGLRLSKNSSKSSQKTCAICLNSMTPGHGQAIFTAECSHSFHFNCITSNVRHGNRICPICRANWKQVPFQRVNSDLLPKKSRADPQVGGWSRDDALMAALRQLPQRRSDSIRNTSATLYGSEPATFDDDEPINGLTDKLQPGHEKESSARNSAEALDIKTYPEVSAISKSSSYNEFTVLVHLKAPPRPSNTLLESLNSRAPVDLVTVLDVSGSMAGTKLALLKRAMGFVIQQLGPQDRLSVIAFSSAAHRLFPLRKVTDSGQTQALQAVNSLKADGGTNIVEGLRKAAKVVTERKLKNAVCSIILLSDGQDTYNVSAGSRLYTSLLPDSVHVPVHVFGFGADHDAATMHSISETSHGTFSFIEAESAIQDAFAQCMGGLLSVVVQQLEVRVECVHSSLQLVGIKAGSYQTEMMPDFKAGCIHVGDLYAEEERDFLVTLNIPEADNSMDVMPLLRVYHSYKEPLSEVEVTSEEAALVSINRPLTMVNQLEVCLEVDRQRNRLRAAEAMAEARGAAERGDLAGAVSILEKCHVELSESVSSQAGDRLCAGLGAELKEMQERMANRRVYESSGRAYVLSGMSSHSWQRATARGDSTDSTSLVQAYQTSSMVDMITRSQTMNFDSLSSQSQRIKLPSSRSIAARLKPR